MLFRSVAKLDAATLAILKLPDIRERLAQEGSEPMGSTPAQFAAYIKSEVIKWGAVVRAAGIKAD